MNITQFDLELLKLIDNLHTPLLDGLMKFITSLGNGGFIWIVSALVLLCFRKTRCAGITLCVALIFCLITGNLLLKPLIARVRPFNNDLSVIPLIPPPTDFSFPSGHTLSSFASATSLCLQDKKWGLASFILAFLIAFSRLYLLVHYPSDIAGGIILGIILGFTAKKITNIFYNKEGDI